MEKDPVERQRDEINDLNEVVKSKFLRVFDDKEDFSSKMDEFMLELDSLERNGLVFNKDEIIIGLKESFSIQDREVFIAHILKILAPLIRLKVTQPRSFGIIERESLLNNKKNIKLSEVLFVSLDELNSGSEEIFIHLASARDFMTKDRVKNFKLEVQKGLTELAKRIQSLPHKKEIWASSWIVAKSPKRLEELGFTIVGEISEEERREHYNGEKRPVAKAFIKREDFLARYYRL